MPQTPSSKRPKPSKKDALLKQLKKPKGASSADLQKATGWQPHTVRAAISRLRKGGLTIERTKEGTAATRYKLMEGGND